MNWFWELPLELRIGLMFFLGTAVAGQINRGVYRLAWNPRQIGPWSAPHPQAPPRVWFDRLPAFGWVGLRREASLHGEGYWLRPMLLELLFGAGLALLYWWEISGGLTPRQIAAPGGRMLGLAPQSPGVVHAQFFAHAVLAALMLTASMIDVDEKIIPDEITLPGALLGLLLAALLPCSLLPIGRFTPPAETSTVPLWIPSPNSWPPWLDERNGLLIGLACFFGWWAAVLDWRWIGRRGPAKALQYLFVRLGRQLWPCFEHPLKMRARLMTSLNVLAVVGICSAWAIQERFGEEHWRALLSSLVGVVFGGGLVWAVRIIGRVALKKEAMGFGDVTLVAMIGAFLGWQPCLVLFFIAPFAGLLIALGQLLLSGRHDIWYGPFLCLGAGVTIVCWAAIWEQYGAPIFWMGPLVPAMVVVCLFMMGAMLTIWRVIKVATGLEER